MRMWIRLAMVTALVAVVAGQAVAQVFTDMATHPSRRAAERLYAKGVVQRLPDGRFAPDEPFTRLDIAVAVTGALGIPLTGVRPPEFRDVDQIPPQSRAAVAAASVMGTVSSQKVELRKGQVIYSLATDKAVYGPTDEIELTFSIANTGPGRETEFLTPDRNRPRLKLTDRDGIKAGLEGELLTETRTAQGVTRERVGRIRVVEARSDSTVVEVVEAGPVAIKPGLKVIFLQDVLFEYSTTQFYDFVIRDQEGNEIARWSLNRRFLAVDRPIALAANQVLSDRTRWRQLDQNSQPVAAGRYLLTATHTTKENPTSLQIAFQRGIISAYPDNTFRPRQPVNRAELAVFMVRAMGLESDALRRANESLQVADARDIPAEARGAVVIALERKLMQPFQDNTFRPTRTATRGEAILALNVLMEALNRYDFVTATLREVRMGPPPVVIIEDSQKQIVTQRVAVVSAIYRNDQVVVLQQLRPGDQLKMLMPRAAAEVLYIEATGR
ncbi:MAG: S-layer homology domain-containing protein [Armatimonadota bacterium]|nr:S-layer homology domain-containing protein [Armatimonadota bacterium]